MTKVGLISDTHGLVRPEALAALADSDVIVHAGDIGKPDVIEQLGEIAPVTAIRGNIDQADWAKQYPEETCLQIAGRKLYVIHSLHDLILDPAEEQMHVVISGHSHKPRIETQEGVLFVNPGSAGPRRFSLPIAVASLVIDEASEHASIIELGL